MCDVFCIFSLWSMSLLKGGCPCYVFCCTINMFNHFIKSCCLEIWILVDSQNGFFIYSPSIPPFMLLIISMDSEQHLQDTACQDNNLVLAVEVWTRSTREDQVPCLVNSFITLLTEATQKISTIAWVLCCEGVTRLKGNGHSSSGQSPSSSWQGHMIIKRPLKSLSDKLKPGQKELTTASAINLNPHIQVTAPALPALLSRPSCMIPPTSSSSSTSTCFAITATEISGQVVHKFPWWWGGVTFSKHTF